MSKISQRALGPVASIILIVVTVAVSVAVAWRMGSIVVNSPNPSPSPSTVPLWEPPFPDLVSNYSITIPSIAGVEWTSDTRADVTLTFTPPSVLGFWHYQNYPWTLGYTFGSLPKTMSSSGSDKRPDFFSVYDGTTITILVNIYNLHSPSVSGTNIQNVPDHVPVASQTYTVIVTKSTQEVP